MTYALTPEQANNQRIGVLIARAQLVDRDLDAAAHLADALGPNETPGVVGSLVGMVGQILGDRTGQFLDIASAAIDAAEAEYRRLAATEVPDDLGGIG